VPEILSPCKAGFKPDRPIVTMFVTIQQGNGYPRGGGVGAHASVVHAGRIFQTLRVPAPTR
jgi:hypothetical protein